MTSRRKQETLHQSKITTVENVPAEKPVEKTEAWRYLVRVGALLTFIISILWLKFDTGYEPLIGFVASFVVFFTTFFRSSQIYIGGWRWLLSHRSKDKRNEMLNRLQGSWIEGVLYTALRDVQEFHIGTSLTPDMIVKARNTGEDYRLRDTSKIAAIYKDFSRLLILGEPGSGKTILLLQLAEMLIQKAHKNEKARIPVVFNLASWSRTQKSLREWLLDEFKTFYRVRRSVASKWLDESTSVRLIVMLDGLDEVREEVRNKCIATINAFDHQYLIVCSRTQDYQQLTEKLSMDNAIMLQPLKEEAVNRYFSRQSGLTGLMSIIEQDRNLREMTTVPFLLNTMIYTYGGRTAAQIGIYSNVIERRQKLFEDYIKRRLEDNPSPYGYNNTLKYLKWLATKMQAYTQTVFRPEELNWYWLDERSQKIYQILTKFLITIFYVSVILFYVYLTVYNLEMIFMGVMIVVGVFLLERVFDKYVLYKKYFSSRYSTIHVLYIYALSSLSMALVFREEIATSLLMGLMSSLIGILLMTIKSIYTRYTFINSQIFMSIFYFCTALYTDRFPQNIKFFLREMSKRHILRPLNGGYVFLHRFLLESLALQDEIEVLLRLFTHYQTAQVAQNALVRFGERAVSPLVSTLHTGGTDAKVIATQTLIQIGSPSIQALIEALYKAQSDRDAEALRFIMASIIQIGFPAISPLLAELHKGDVNYTHIVAATLSLIDHEEAISSLVSFLKFQMALFDEEIYKLSNKLPHNNETIEFETFKVAVSSTDIARISVICDVVASVLKDLGTEEALEANKSWQKWKPK